MAKTNILISDPELEGVPFDTVDDVDGSFTTLPSFSEALPYRDFNSEHGLFILGGKDKKERYVGAMWEYATFTHDANSLPGQKLNIANLMEDAINQLPDGYAFQFIVDSDRNVSAYLPPPPPPVEDNNKLLDMIYAEQVGFLHESSITGLWGKRNVYPRTMRFRICVFNAPRKITLGERAISKIEKEELETSAMSITEQLITFTARIQKFEQMFKNHGFPLKRRGAQDLIGYFHQYMHKGMFREGLAAPRHIPRVDLARQLLRVFPLTHDKYVYCDGHYYRSTAATMVPSFTVPCKMYDLMTIPGDIHICLSGYVPAQDKEKNNLRMKGNIAQWGVSNPFGREDNDNSAIRNDVDMVEKEMIGGKKMFHFSFSIVNISETYKQANEFAGKIKAKIAELEMPLLTDNILSQSLFKASLPFHYAPLEPKNHLYRTFLLPSHFFSHMIPATGAWLGTEHPGTIGLTRTCEPFYFDFFDAVAPHFLLTGETGTGKGGFINMLMPGALKQGYTFFIIDPLGTYKKACKAYGGEYISFDLNNPVSYNPFNQRELDQERLLLLSNWLTSIMSYNGDALGVGDVALIDKFIKSTYDKLKIYNRPPELENFHNFLKTHGEQRGADLAERLSFYVGNGKYSNFFRQSTFNLNNNLVIFDISGLTQSPELMNAMLMSIMLLIGDVVKNKTGRKILVMDEFHRIVPANALSGTTAEFVENAFRTYRHHQTAVGIMTQNVSVLKDMGRVGEVCLTQPYNQIFFNQSKESILRAIGHLGLTESDAHVISQLKSVMGFYSEAFVRVKQLRTGGSGKSELGSGLGA
ncbi:MAG: TraC family protein [Nitrospirae bacterium]|nr:TraC family protein [Nitrospirota bacterium]